jgi:hypothetical protein
MSLRIAASGRSCPPQFVNRGARVPRYYFDLIDGADTHPDDEGTELPGLKSARDEASEALLGLARDKIPFDGRSSRVLRIVVRGEDGGKLLTVTLNYAEEPADWPAGSL